MKILKVTLLIVFSLVLAACEIELTSAGNNDEEHSDVALIVRKMTAETEIIDHGELYDFELEGESNKLTLKSNLKRIDINGSYNEIIIVDDDYIDRLIIKGNRNTFTIEHDDVDINEIVIEGDDNYLVFSQCQSLVDVGENNQILLLEDVQCEIVE